MPDHHLLSVDAISPAVLILFLPLEQLPFPLEQITTTVHSTVLLPFRYH